MRQEGFFEQPFAAMPISDYVRAFFLDRRLRVTRKTGERYRAAVIAISKVCPIKAGANNFDRRRQYRFGDHKLAALHGRAGKNTDAREFRAPLVLRSGRQMKKARHAGLL
jgi:hypothetical protein